MVVFTHRSNQRFRALLVVGIRLGLRKMIDEEVTFDRFLKEAREADKLEVLRAFLDHDCEPECSMCRAYRQVIEEDTNESEPARRNQSVIEQDNRGLSAPRISGLSIVRT
jgi:hypothetical protein